MASADAPPNASPGNVQIGLAKEPHKYTKVSIEDEANFLSKTFFWWTNTIIDYGAKHAFEEKDLFEVRKDEKFSYAWNFFLKHYNDASSKAYRSVIKSLFAVCGKNFWYSTIMMIIANLLQFAGPLLLKEILKYIAIPGIPEYKGYLYATGMLLAFILRAILTQHGAHETYSFSFKTLTSTQTAIFNKILNIKASARGYVDTGKIVNLATVDSLGIFRFCTMMSYLTTAPFTLIVALALIINEVGASGLMGLAVIFIGTILNGIVSGKIFQIRFGGLVYNDQRSKAITEYISGMRVIKYYGWEKFALKKVDEIRKKETDLLYRLAVWRGLLDFLTNLIPLCISIAVFGVYVASGNDLTPARAFTTLSLFNLIQIPIRMLGFSLFFFANTKVSFKRIQHFSDWENHEPVAEDQSLPVGQIKIQNGNFSWDTPATKAHSEAMKVLFAPRGMGKKGGPPGKKGGPPAVKGKEADSANGKPVNTPELQKKGTDEADSPSLTKHQSSIITRQETETRPLMREESTKPKTPEAILSEINLDIRPGEFIGVIGQVGSGKSSLVNAMIGEMNKDSGEVKLRGSIAYVSQQAWLRNATLRENILFGYPYDEAKYQHVLRICELTDDIAMLPGGDQTEIGERGINLSGGQKQRVAIARAVYANADIYIIDDCLSALDAHVGRQIYEHVLRGELAHKTIIFVTHALHYVAEADRVVVMKQGKIVECDSPNVLKNISDSEYNRLTINTKPTESESPTDEAKKAKADKRKADTAAKGAEGKKVEQNQEALQKKGMLGITEERATGAVPFRVYKEYITSGGALFTTLAIILFLLSQGCRQVTDWWLSKWSSNSYSLSSGDYILWYFIISFVTAMSSLLRGFIFGLFTRQTSMTLFSKLLYSIFRSPMSWFDVTPSGRILNRTSKDQDDIDSNLPFTIQMSVQNLLQLIGTIIFIGVITPLFFAFAAVLVIYYIYALHVYLKASRELKRVERLTLGPALSLFSECANGYHVIRAFKREQIFVQMFAERFDKYLKAASGGANLERWVSLRTDLFAALVVGASAFFGVLAKTFNTTDDPGLIGLSISWSLTITGLIAFAIKTLSDTELQMNSVERILQYIHKTEAEAEWENPRAPQAWPTAGKIEADKITYKYREGLPDVIHGISFSIASNERIGVVGRTGSGKSTLTLGLLRILELAEKGGKKGHIDLDGTVIGNIGLHELRKKITIIPQDPVLFTGTVKSNVDPFNEYPDKDIIEALKKVQIWDQLKMLEVSQGQPGPGGHGRPPSKVDAKKLKNANKNPNPKAIEMTNLTDDERKLRLVINDGGSNFSLGQRQLICMARALVRRPKVLLMDEATASIDELTDYLIQKMIKTEFIGTTVITIAHRLNTIIQYDRILVLDQGNIAEFDSPINLLDQGDSYFAKLVKENGPEFEQKMRYLAQHKELNLDEITDIPA